VGRACPHGPSRFFRGGAGGAELCSFGVGDGCEFGAMPLFPEGERFPTRLPGVTRRRWLLVLAASGVAVLAVALLFPAVVRWRVAAAAERAGLSVTIGSVRLGWGRVWLRNVDVGVVRLPGASARLVAVEAVLGWSGVGEVALHGGEVKVTASREQIVDAFRAKGTSPSGGSNSKRTLRGKGLFVEWVPEPRESVVVWGVAFERSQSGSEASADLVEVQHRLGALTARSARATFDTGFQVRAASTGDAQLRVALDTLLETLGQREEGVRNPAPKSSTALDRGGRAAPVWGGAAALPSLDGARGARMWARAKQLAGLVARRLPEGGSIEFGGLTVRLNAGEGGVTLGPAEVRVVHEPNTVSVNFSPAQEARAEHRMALTARLPIEKGETRLEVAGGPVRLSALGIRDGDLGLQGVDHANLEIRAAITLSDDGKYLEGSSTGRVDGLAILRPALGRLPLEGISLGWDVKGGMSTDASSFSMDSGEFNLGAVRIEAKAAVQQAIDGVNVSLRLEVPLGSCSEMLTSLPRNLVPFSSELRLGGTFSWRTALAFDSRRLSDMELEWRMQDDCRFEKVPASLSTDRFRGVFSREVPDSNGFPIRISTGPGSDQWTPLGEVSRFMEAAVLVSEDGRFWSHRGFDQRAIESSIRQNVEAGRFVRGASTISMQLAKNLYLTREKTLSRKVQEALLTMLLEQELRKDEILELYFNVIELGPGLYGLRQGAQHYFRTTPSDLSVAQSFFLATLLPSPSAQHFDESGLLKPHWRGYVDRLMRIAAERDRISEADLQAGLAETLQFGMPAHPDGGGIEVAPPDSTTGDPVPF
jgi:hypothetical protein